MAGRANHGQRARARRTVEDVIHGRQHGAGCQTSDVVGIWRREGVFIDHRRTAPRGDNAGNVVMGVNSPEIFVGSLPRIQYGAPVLTEPSSNCLKGFRSLRPFRVSRRCDVIDESARADENHRHAVRLVHLPVNAAFHLTSAPAG